ncbi:MAG: rhomboid family intramembrane serine protease [Bacteroidota bacterium]
MDQDLRKIIYSFFLPLALAAIMVLLHVLVEAGLIDKLDYAIHPQSLSGVVGIFTGAFFHGDWQHLLGNLSVFVMVGAVLRYFYRKVSLQVLFFGILTAGLGTWLFGRPYPPHLGASGLVNALIFFLFFSGVFRKDRVALVLSLLVAFLYGGVVWGLLPIEEGISWEGHLSGAIGGILMAWIFRGVNPPPSPPKDDERIDYTGPFWNYKDLIPPPDGFQYPE